MPKLKAVLDSLDGLPDAQKSLYEEGEDGKFHLSAEGIEDVGGLKSALEKERKERKAAERKLKELGDIDPDEVQRLRDAEDARADKETDVEKGNERTAKSGDKRFSLEDLVSELKADDEFAGAFNGTGASGSGAPPSGSRGAPPKGRVDTESVEQQKRSSGAYAVI
jgi:hypothetical protein